MRSERFVIIFETYVNLELLGCTPETNMILYFNYTSIKQLKS